MKLREYFLVTMFLLSFWALNVSVTLLSMQGQKALEKNNSVPKMNEDLMGLERRDGE